MRLLFDQNISFRIISKVKETFPEAKQVKQLGIENYSDIEIWNFAKKNEYTIVTFDSYFFDVANIKGHPPKIIWLRIGNTNTSIIADLINKKNTIFQILYPLMNMLK